MSEYSNSIPPKTIRDALPTPGVKQVKRKKIPNENPVSLWFGSVATKNALDSYLFNKYTKDGDVLPSRFEKDFNIEGHDEDFREAEKQKSSRSVRKLLAGCSYEEVVVPKFVELLGENLPESFNTLILLLDFEHTGVTEVKRKNMKMKYMGCVDYLKKPKRTQKLAKKKLRSQT